MAKKLQAVDIILVQELFSYYPKMGCAFGHEFQSQKMDTMWVGDGLARYSRVPFKHYKRVKWRKCHGVLSNQSDCLAPKGFSSAIHHIGDIDVLIYNLHMDSGTDFEDKYARMHQVNQLLDDTRLTELPILLTGDFNFRGAPAFLDKPNVLKTFGFIDACDKLNCSGNLIDRVLYRDSKDIRLIPSYWNHRKELNDEVGVSYSDHYPVEVRFRWERNEDN